MGKVYFNGVSSEEFGLIVQAPPSFLYPERDTETAHIPGRNGDLIIDKKCYKNTSRTYNFALVYVKNTNYIENSVAVTNWLQSAFGDYARLEDTYEPDWYRMARYVESNQFANHYDKAMSFNVNFECKPQKFLKSGEEEIRYYSSSVYIENPTIYDSLPLITIEGIDDDNSKVLMMSVEDSMGVVNSNLTLSFIENGVVSIDSEDENCFDNNGYVNDKVGLNGKNFPKLGKGFTKISIEKYTRDDYDIDKYDLIISNNQIVCKSEYKPYDVLESEQQSKYYVKSFASIIENQQIKFSASSYQSFIEESAKKQLKTEAGVVQCDQYTFESFNKLLDTYAMQFPIYGTLADNPSISGDGNGYIKAENSPTKDDTLVIKATANGFFTFTNDKTIKYYSAGSVITECKTSSSISVYYYPTENEELTITYKDLPNWLKFKIIYNQNEDGIKTPYEIQFIAAKNGRYWSEKTWIFGKPKWTYHTENAIIGKLQWSNIKKAFMPTTGITVSTTTTFTYKYLWDTDIQYDTEIISIETVGAKTDNADALQSIKLNATKSGYYSYILNDDVNTKIEWKSCSVGTTIGTILGTYSFRIMYLKSYPTYAEEEGWPDWLSPEVITTPTASSLEEDSYVSFKVKKNSYYRYSYITKNDKNEDVENFTQWVYMTDGTTLDFLAHKKKATDSFYICQIESMPATYPNDRCFSTGSLQSVTDDDGNEKETLIYSDPSPTPPDMLLVSYSKPSDTDPVGEVVYKAAKSGYFKWDANTSWQKKNQDDDLFTSGYKDNTTFYYLEELPDYPDDYDLFKMVISEDTTGNPNNVEFVVESAGYYRVNNNSDWTYFQVDDSLYNATVNESVKIHHLTKSDEILSNIIIKIIPRWWTL